jgi:protein-tyrosine phosphatase
VIDLHSHILPGVDDGAPDLKTALAMARMAAADGIQVMAATPHFMPGMYDNEAGDIRSRVEVFNRHIADAGIPLAVVTGADAHIRPDFLPCLRDGRILTVNDSRYVLFEPPHNIMPQRLEDMLFNIYVSGFVPVLTHPERLKWIEQHYDAVVRLFDTGIWMQITAGSLTGRFGRRPKYWAERMLNEGRIHVLATDAHNLTSRPPLLAEAHALAEKAVGLDEARNLVLIRPLTILDNEVPEAAPPVALAAARPVARKSGWRRLFGGG